MAYGQDGNKVILLLSEESMEHSRKVGENAFAEAKRTWPRPGGDDPARPPLSLPGSCV